MKSARGSVLTLVTLALLAASARADDKGWPQRAGGSKDDGTQAVAKDDAGNIYIAGRFEGTATFGPFSLVSAGAADVFVAKMDNVGNWLWAKRAGGAQNDSAAGIAVDDSGNVYITGSFQGSASFGSIAITGYGSGDSDVFAAKLDQFGSFRWAKAATGSQYAAGLAVSVNALSEAYVTGTFAGSLSLPGAAVGSTLNTPNYNQPGVATDLDVFVAKLTEGGDWRWGYNISGDSTDDTAPLHCLDTDVGSNWCCDAWGWCWLGFSNDACISIFGGYDNAAYSLYGRPYCLGGGVTNAYSDDRGTAIKAVTSAGADGLVGTADDSNSVYVAGSFQTKLLLLQQPAAAGERQRDMFVLKMTDFGGSATWRWVLDSTHTAATDAMAANAVTADADGNVYVAGSYVGAPKFGALNSLTSTAGLSSPVSTDVPRPINDNATTISEIVVPEAGRVTDVNVSVTLTHTWDADLALTLIAPDGTQVPLSSHRGGSGDNYTGTVFDDGAATAISAGTAPFAGSYQPESPLIVLNGKSAAGTWRLRIDDTAFLDTGNISSWSLALNSLGTGVYVAKVADNGASATFSWGTDGSTRNGQGMFAEASSLALDSRMGTDQGLYLTGSYRGTVGLVKRDLSITDGSPVVTSPSAFFLANGLVAGGTIEILDAPNAGIKTILSVDSETQLTLTAALSGTATSVGFVYQTLVNTAPSSGNLDVMVAKLHSADGDWVWAKGGGSLFDDTGVGLVSDDSGTTFVGGRFQGLGRFTERTGAKTYTEAVQGTYNVSETTYGVSFWFRTAATGCANCGLFSVLSGPLGNNGNDRHVYLQGGRLFARVWSNEVIASPVGPNYADGQWHHVAHTYGPGVGQRLFVDGALVASGAKTQSDFNWQTDVAIGFSNDAQQDFFDGLIHDVRIFNRVLNAADSTNGGPPCADTGTVTCTNETALKAAGAGDAFMASLNPEAPGQWRSFEAWVIGEEVPRPSGVPPLQPEIQIGEEDGAPYFFWSVYEKRLYAVRPTAALIRWRVSSSPSDTRRVLTFGASDWPTNPQIHVAGAPVDLQLASSLRQAASCSLASPPDPTTTYTYAGIRYSTNAAIDANRVFDAQVPGYAVLLYVKGPNADTTAFPALLQVVKTVSYDDPAYLTDNVAAEIGTKLDPTPASCQHDDPTGKNGWVLFPAARFDGAGPDRVHDRPTRSGPIIPVNEAPLNDMAVVWYQRSARTGMAWPSLPYRYAVAWPASPYKIVVASELGSEWGPKPVGGGGLVISQPILSDADYPNKRVYSQPDPNQAGFNPNEEHADFFLSNAGSGEQAVFALRSDLTNGPEGLFSVAQSKSKPYVLLKYQDKNTTEWKFLVYHVLAIDADYPDFEYPGRAGNPVYAPYPVRMLGDCAETSGTGRPFWKDYKNQTWARSAGTITGRYAYPLRPGWYYDLDGNGTQDKSVGQCVPWLDRMPVRTDCPGGAGNCVGTPIAVTYKICWPDEVSHDFGAGAETCEGAPKVLGTDFGFLQAGETLTAAKNGAPNIKNQPAAAIVYDDQNPNLKVPGAEPPTGLPDPTKQLANLIDPFSERKVFIDPALYGGLDKLPTDIQVENAGGFQVLVGGTGGSPVKPQKLPFYLRARVFYDPIEKKLGFKGYIDESGAGEPLLLINVMTQRERQRLKDLSQDSNWPNVVEALYRLTRNPRGLRLRASYNPSNPRAAVAGVCTLTSGGAAGACPAASVTKDALLVGLQDADNDGVPEPFALLGPGGALTAGAATGPVAAGGEYVTVAVGNNPVLSPLPVDLKVIKVICGPYRGQVQVIQPDNVFDEQLTLRHSGDFGGDPDRLDFEWFTSPDIDGTPPALPDPQIAYGDPSFPSIWEPLTLSAPHPNGAIDVTIEGANVKTLSDNWFAVRYKGFNVCNNSYPGGSYSAWSGQPAEVGFTADAQFGPGWIKRVTEGLNPFETRVKDFHKAATATYASMIQQFGPRYEGDIAFSGDPSNINNVGLIEAYETVLRRGKKISIDGTPAINYGPVNKSLLNVATRLSDFYTLLGSEAYADAQDPTIGFGTKSGAYGNLAPTIFAFQNQLDSLLDEELVLLRGRDASNATTSARPVYNRLYWNFTNGEGEVAYSQVYNISDVGGCSDVTKCGQVGAPDGVINEKDARIMFPQGHGDAWGHYLTAQTTWYSLLRHPYYTWENRPEAVLVAGVPVQVDYLDERKFAKTAALKAKAGAEIVDLEYRQAYVEDPAGQWQGYKDTDPARAWGLSEWGKRAGQAAYFDWVVANSLLPDVDPDSGHTGIQKIDRTTVSEIGDIAAQYSVIESKVDQADYGLNPLGLAKGVVPFDIDPALIERELTHFEQIQERSLKALGNAVVTFDNANQISQMLRQNQDTLEDFSRNVGDQERDYKNRLIEIFGYPYSDDIGPAGTYPTGYDGPDFYHYFYVDSSELTGDKAPPTKEVTARFSPVAGIGFFYGDDANALAGSAIKKDVKYTISLNGFGIVKPQSFVGRRRAPGEIQRALGDLFTERARFEQCQKSYDNLLKDIQDQADLLQAQYNVNASQISILNKQKNTIIGLNVGIGIAKAAQLALKRASKMVQDKADAAAAAIPTVTIAGLAVGGDFFSALRGVFKGVGSTLADILDIAADVAEVAQTAMELSKEQVQLETEIELQVASQNFEVLQKTKELEALMREEPGQRLECYIQKGVVEQAQGNYFSTLASGQRLIEELVSFRAQTAADVQDYRYQDMAFRVFRNDALQKYRAQFDLAARYAYLAAAAYDYETNLLGSASGAGRRFLTDIVKQRSLGQVLDGTPIAGSRGLADPLARLGQNFDVLKGQLGFNNPQTETNRFSMRKELFRQYDQDGHDVTDPTDGAWRDNLARYRVANLWDVPEFKRYCRAFAPETAGPQPGLVIPFSTTVTFGLNFFGWPLGGGDSTYDPTNFATKVRSVGVWFGNYDATGLSNTPRVYLVPAGADVLRSPTGNSFATREWRVADQVLPVPFPIGASDLANPGFIPVQDNLSDAIGGIRRLSSFRAYHLGEGFDDSQMSSDSRLIGRSVWNTRWLLIIPGGTFLFDPNQGLDTLIYGQPVPGTIGQRDGNGISDIQIFFQTYAYSGN